MILHKENNFPIFFILMQFFSMLQVSLTLILSIMFVHFCNKCENYDVLQGLWKKNVVEMNQEAIEKLVNCSMQNSTLNLFSAPFSF